MIYIQNILIHNELKPFVKWAGGKSQLLNELLKHTPKIFNNYLEPFIGGGALLFKLKPNSAIINDLNQELINCYNVIKFNPEDLISDLQNYKNEKEFYYKIRTINSLKLNSIERASRFIYLNKTCFNGLWRVNKDNQFNTPFGNYKNPNIVNEELLFSISDYLKSVDIFSLDFQEFLLKYAKEGDFIYLDPPYVPISEYSDFNRYTKESFNLIDQKRLAKVFITLDKKGCNLLLSNSYSKLVLDLYSNFNINIVNARRSINKDPNGRGYIKEILVNNYGKRN